MAFPKARALSLLLALSSHSLFPILQTSHFYYWSYVFCLYHDQQEYIRVAYYKDITLSEFTKIKYFIVKL